MSPSITESSRSRDRPDHVPTERPRPVAVMLAEMGRQVDVVGTGREAVEPARWSGTTRC